jgi:hypothetical protein
MWLLYGKRSEQFLHVGRNGAFEGQKLPRNRMLETQFSCVERLPFEVQSI